MAPKKNPAASTSAAPSSKPTNLYVVDKVWNGYWETTSHQTLVIDAFLVFLLLVGGIQFLYFLTCSHDVSKPALPCLLLYGRSSKLTRRPLSTALQCLPRRLYRHRRPVRSDRYVCTHASPPPPRPIVLTASYSLPPHADRPAQQEPVSRNIPREVSFNHETCGPCCPPSYI